LAILSVDGPSSGRGAWLCRDDITRPDGDVTVGVVADCLDRAIANKQFGRVWRTSLDSADVEAIRAALRRDEQPTS
jgi:hypothetical protein